MSKHRAPARRRLRRGEVRRELVGILGILGMAGIALSARLSRFLGQLDWQLLGRTLAPNT